MRLHYDQGTIRIEEPPAGFDPGRLPGATWDPRVRLFRAPARFHAEIAAALARLGLAFDDEAGPPARRVEGWSPVDLRPYQAAALAAWTAAECRGIVVLPTGSGKTRVAIAAMAAQATPALCLVPTKILLAQWADEIGKLRAGDVGRLGDGSREVSDVTVATYESAWRWMPSIGRRFGLVVVDEVHHFGRGLRDEALDMSVATRRLGLTATPGDDPGAIERLRQLVGPIVFEQAIADLSGRWLAEFDLFTLTLPLTSAERSAYESELAIYRPFRQRFVEAFPDATWREFLKVAAASDEGRRALAAWRATRKILSFTRAKADTLRNLLERHGDCRTLVFTAENETAYAVAREHLVMPITCDIGRAERAEAVGRFARGELAALVSSRVLNEGFDVPDADVAVVLGGWGGDREYVQRIGRLLRPRPGKRARIYELVSGDTIEVAQSFRRRARLAARTQDR